MNRIYKIIRNQSTGQTVVTSELAKSNKKSLSGKLLVLSVTGMLVTTSISTAQAIPLITNNSALGSLPWVLSQVSENNIVQFDVGINPTNINAIRIDKENITIQGNQENTLNTEATINAINNLVNIAHTQHADDYAEFDYWLAVGFARVVYSIRRKYCKQREQILHINDSNRTKEVSVGDTMARNSFGLGLSAATSLTSNLSLEGNYHLNLASHTQAHQAKFTLSYAF